MIYFETWVLRVGGPCDIATGKWAEKSLPPCSALPHQVPFSSVFSDSCFKPQIIQKDALCRSLYTVVIYLQMLPQVLFCQCVLNLIPVGAAGLQLTSSLPWARLGLLIINLHYHILCNSCFSLPLCNFPALYPPRKKRKKSGLHKLWKSPCHLWSIGL